MRTPTYTKEFKTYPEADAWITAGKYTECIINHSRGGETRVTLEGEFALRAQETEEPIVHGGFRLNPVERAW